MSDKFYANCACGWEGEADNGDVCPECGLHRVCAWGRDTDEGVEAAQWARQRADSFGGQL